MNTLHTRTPLLESMPMNTLLNKQVFLKLECCQPVGSFKIRGLGRLCEYYLDQGITHFVSASGGNAGYAVAYSGRKLGIAVTVFVPKTTNPLFVKLIEAEGAKVKVGGDDLDAAHQSAITFSEKVKGAYIPPFDHPTIWTGHATMVDELVEQCPKPDVIVVSVGGGGLLCGILEGMYQHDWQDVPIIAVETEGTASLAASMQANKLVTLDKITGIATSLGAKRVAERMFEWSQKHDITPVTVSDAATVRACRHFADDHRLLVEPACGAALSVIYDKLDVLKPYHRILVIVCGGIGMSIDLLHKYEQQFK